MLPSIRRKLLNKKGWVAAIKLTMITMLWHGLAGLPTIKNNPFDSNRFFKPSTFF